MPIAGFTSIIMLYHNKVRILAIFFISSTFVMLFLKPYDYPSLAA